MKKIHNIILLFSISHFRQVYSLNIFAHFVSLHHNCRVLYFSYKPLVQITPFLIETFCKTFQCTIHHNIFPGWGPAAFCSEFADNFLELSCQIGYQKLPFWHQSITSAISSASILSLRIIRSKSFAHRWRCKYGSLSASKIFFFLTC